MTTNTNKSFLARSLPFLITLGGASIGLHIGRMWGSLCDAVCHGGGIHNYTLKHGITGATIGGICGYGTHRLIKFIVTAYK